MTKRLIGIDIGLQTLRLAVLSRDQGVISVVTVEESTHKETLDQLLRVQEYLKGDYRLGDRLATCLPSGAAFVRRLSFPFSDRRKIMAALPFELSAQLPVALDEYTTVAQPPVRNSHESGIIAAAVKTSHLTEVLKPFDTLGLPLHVLDLAPHAYVSGLKDYLTDGILVCAMEQGASLALVSSGEVLDYRHLPLTAEMPVTKQARAIHREATAFGQSDQPEGMTLQLMGPLATPELVTALSELRNAVELLCIDINGKKIEAPFLPAVALALRAEESGKAQAFNLRQGHFALKGEWVSLRKALVIAACLATLTLVTLAATMGLGYYDKQRQVNIVEQQMVALYQQTFPNATRVVDVPLQMKSAILQLQEELGVSSDDRPPSLLLLQMLSDLPESLNVDIDEFTMERDEARIMGSTGTFEAVNQIVQFFLKSPNLDTVEVTESKMDIQGRKVNFRIRMTLSVKGASS